jgi:hypothetical protein
MDPVTASIFVALCNTTAAVRVFRFAVCAFWLVVTPVPTVTVHSDIAGRSAVVAVSVSVAVVVPELVAAAVNAVLPHPVDVLRLAGDAMTNVGSTNAMVSAVLAYSRGAFSSKVYETEDFESVCGSANTKILVVSAGATVAVDVEIPTALISATAANVTPAVRPTRFAACVAAAFVTPVDTVTLHS